MPPQTGTGPKSTPQEESALCSPINEPGLDALLGRMVSVHPLGVLVAIACGILVAGVAGALIAVPLVAALNAVAVHLSGDGAAPAEARRRARRHAALRGQ